MNGHRKPIESLSLLETKTHVCGAVLFSTFLCGAVWFSNFFCVVLCGSQIFLCGVVWFFKVLVFSGMNVRFGDVCKYFGGLLGGKQYVPLLCATCMLFLHFLLFFRDVS